MSEKTLQNILQLLKENNITYKHEHHLPISKSSLEASKIRGTNISHGAKALVIETKSGKIIQAIVPADKKVNLNLLRKIIGEKNIFLASPENVFEITDCVVGSVPPLGVLWNFNVFIDKSLLELDTCVFSSGTLEDSIWISPKDLVEINQAAIVEMIKEN